MRFLIDACLPRDFTPLLQSYDHVAVDIRAIGMANAKDSEVAAHAQANQFCLLTEDWGFADIRVDPPASRHGIVVFEMSDSSIDAKLAALRHLLERGDIVEALPGRLAIVTSTRIRIRPPL